MKFISWNVNGIRACVQKGFLEFFHEADADIFCIQETKMQEGTAKSGIRRLSSVLELCCEEGVFRNSRVYKERTIVGELRNRY